MLQACAIEDSFQLHAHCLRSRRRRGETRQRQALVSSQDLRGTKAVALLLYMRARGIGRAAKAAREHGGQAGGSSGAGLGQENRPDRGASEEMEEQQGCRNLPSRRGENSAPDVYATKYPKRTRVVEEGEEARGPKRPRRPRVPEGAYKQTATRERREPEEERERKIRKCAVVPVGSEALKRMEERQ